MDKYNNLTDWFGDEPSVLVEHDIVPTIQAWLIKLTNQEVVLQFHGFELILLPNGTYILNDTSGG